MHSFPVARIVLYVSIVAASTRALGAEGGGTPEGLLARLTNDLAAFGYDDQARTIQRALEPQHAWQGDLILRKEGDTSERLLLVSKAREWGAGHVEARIVFSQGVWGLGEHPGWKDTRPSTFQIMTTLDLEHHPGTGVWKVGLLTRDPYRASQRHIRLAAGPEGLRLVDRAQRDAHHIGHSETERQKVTTVLRRTAVDGSVTIEGVHGQSGHREVTDQVKGRVTLHERRPGAVERLPPRRVR